MFCSYCNINKEIYDFVLPPSDIDNSNTNEICRKCYHLKRNINDDDYDHFINIYRLCNESINATIILIEKVQNDIETNNIEKYNLGYTPEEFIESLHGFIESYNIIMRIVNTKMKHIENWTTLINNM